MTERLAVQDAINVLRGEATASEGELMQQLRAIADLAGKLYDQLDKGEPVAAIIDRQDFETLMRRAALAYAWGAECAAKRDTLDAILRLTRNHLQPVTS